MKIRPDDKLTNVQLALVKKWKDDYHLPYRSGKRFHPHLTMAFRDLAPQMFSKAWDVYKDEPFESSFDVNKIWLLKHNGKSWDEHQSFDLAAGDPVGE